MIRALAATLLLAPLAAASAAEPAAQHFAPLQFLLGHCWGADFGDGKRDVQCFRSMYDGALVHNTHVVVGSEPRYEGTTIYSWDAGNERLRFHYFTSTGAVSEGHLRATADGYTIPERHVGPDGNLIELESTFSRDGEHAYRVVTRQRRGEEWIELGAYRYQSLDAPGQTKPSAAIETADGEYLLAWSSDRFGDWDVIVQDASGQQHRTTPAGSNEWLWDGSGDALLLLGSARAGDEAAGWRMHRMRADGSGLERIGDVVVDDGFFTCVADGKDCVAALKSGTRQRIARFIGGKQGEWLELGPADAADPQFSPDGTQLLFRSNRSGHWELWLANTDGSGARALTSDAENDSVAAHHYNGEGPARFSPDGRSIAWMRRFPDRGYDVWTLEIESGAMRNLTADHAGDDGYPAWSPDGRTLAFDSDREGNSEIHLMDPDGGNVRRVSWSPGADLAPLWVREHAGEQE